MTMGSSGKCDCGCLPPKKGGKADKKAGKAKQKKST
jgi:hypothetical protein